MATVVGRVSREIYRRELVPARLRWWMAAAGMRDWCRIIDKKLRPSLGDETREVMGTLLATTLERRYQAMRATYGHLPTTEQDPRALPLVFSALYRLWTAPKASWVVDSFGGPPRGAEWLKAHRLIEPLSAVQRWEEVTVHLGELLIVMTEDLGQYMPHARRTLATICFDMGARLGSKMKTVFDLPDDGNAPAHAIEVLRVSEYIFRVNPDHWSDTDAAAGTGFLEGNACPWFDRPGWHGGHCGIFGQFQSGIASAFGLSYRLTQTIPKHGGTTCRIDLKPIPLGISRPPS